MFFLYGSLAPQTPNGLTHTPTRRPREWGRSSLRTMKPTDNPQAPSDNGPRLPPCWMVGGLGISPQGSDTSLWARKWRPRRALLTPAGTGGAVSRHRVRAVISDSGPRTKSHHGSRGAKWRGVYANNTRVMSSPVSASMTVNGMPLSAHDRRSSKLTYRAAWVSYSRRRPYRFTSLAMDTD